LPIVLRYGDRKARTPAEKAEARAQLQEARLEAAFMRASAQNGRAEMMLNSRASLRDDAKARRGTGRHMAALLQAELSNKQRELIEERYALRSSIGYQYRHWSGRSDTVYDRKAWHRGRLVARRQPRTAEDRRNVVSWVEILDREAQEQGTTPDDLMREADKARALDSRLTRRASDLADEARHVREVAAQLRSGNQEHIERMLERVDDAG
jgi:hypothetical protein